MNLRIALTPGEPAGIGPDLTILLAQQPRTEHIVAIADKNLLISRAQQLQLPLTVHDYIDSHSVVATQAGSLSVLHVKLNAPCTAGLLNPENARYVLTTLELAIDGCKKLEFAAMVTAPLHKGVINDAGITFTGHTEYLAEHTQSKPVMMLVANTPSGPLRVALATTHLPLSQVPKALTHDVLAQALRILHADLIQRFNIQQPRILIAGLNPHAGEGGHMGREEINVIEPVLNELKSEGMLLTGPLPADTLFTAQHLDTADAVMAMYHDQGLPVLKYAGFGEAVNITLGLPIIRTSVDHGTALDKAGTGNIDSGSLAAALALAGELVLSQHSGPSS